MLASDWLSCGSTILRVILSSMDEDDHEGEMDAFYGESHATDSRYRTQKEDMEEHGHLHCTSFDLCDDGQEYGDPHGMNFGQTACAVLVDAKRYKQSEVGTPE